MPHSPAHLHAAEVLRDYAISQGASAGFHLTTDGIEMSILEWYRDGCRLADDMTAQSLYLERYSHYGAEGGREARQHIADAARRTQRTQPVTRVVLDGGTLVGTWRE